MKLLLLSLLALGCSHVLGAPVEEADGLEPGSCEDASAVAAAGLALTKINRDRQEGYVFALHRLANVHMKTHEENGVVFYLTMDVVETNCSVLSRKDWKTCEARPTHDTPVYGQCKAAIFISKVHRVVRLYKYNCAVRPVPSARVAELCPDCPTFMDKDGAQIQKAVSLSLEKFNQESGLANRFVLLAVTRATSGMAMSMYYNVEYTIQETTCARNTETPDKCPIMDCEFAHKGFCKASLFDTPAGDPGTSVECEIYEPEAGEREKKMHFATGDADHSHNDSHTHAHGSEHDQEYSDDKTTAHDHVHDHTKGHEHHDHAHDHAHDHDHDHAHDHADHSGHHHTHDHGAGSAHRHAHAHSHDHGHDHDHAHTHHAKAHNHSGDFPNQHHDYKHADGTYTHEHDHELALDHEHKHGHLHEHEHHHHHHEHQHEAESHDHPKGVVRMLPAVDQPTTLPLFPDVPAAGPEVGVVLPLKPDPQIPGQMEPPIQAFPAKVSAQCPPPALGSTLVEKLFIEDATFKAAA